MGLSSKFSFIAVTFILAAIVAFLSDWVQKIGLLTFPSGFRNLIILFIFLLNWIFFNRKMTFKIGYKFCVISISVFLVIAFFFSPATLLNYTLGIIFTFLFVVIFILGATTKTYPNEIITIFNWLVIFFLFLSVIPVLGGLLSGLSLRFETVFFRELGAFGSAMNIGTILCISLFIITSKKKYLYLAVFFSFGILITILKKSIVSNIIVWLAFFIFNLNSKARIKLIFYSSIVIAIVYFTFGKDFSENFIESSAYLQDTGVQEHVRIGMYIASFKIATDFFPFGSGMGTFGSLASITAGYSNIHFIYGVANIGYNSPEDAASGMTTILDTYWPHILGELGFIGTLLFLYLWFFPVRLPLKLIRVAKDPVTKGLSFYIIMTIITVFWEGFSLYTPEIPSFILLHAGLTGLCYFHIARIQNPINLVSN
ncbi:MAG: hypothetical protein H7Z13_00950 [Ferruginibacter sp.]|nr:hypothetical protein [Ferruginibacter sp.]